MDSDTMKDTNAKTGYGAVKDFLGKFENSKIVMVLIVMCVLLTILAPAFLSARNLINVIRQISITCILAMGTTMIIVSGGIDLSCGSIIALSGVVAASFAHPDAYPLIVPLVLALVTGLIAGSINGILISKGKLPPFIATLGMMTTARGLTFFIAGGKPISGLTDAFQFIGGGNVAGIPFPIVVLLTVVILSVIIMNKLRFGRYVYALGGNEVAARVSGINISKMKIAIYAYGGLMSAIAGVVLAARINTGHPGSGVGYELDAIAATVIGGSSLSGGVGTVVGTVIGALIIGVISNGLDILGVSSYFQQMIKGVIIIGAVLLDTLKAR